jgi:hypothetical protein
MLREYANDVPFKAGGFIVQVRCHLFYPVAMCHELRFPLNTWCTLYLCQPSISPPLIIVNANANALRHALQFDHASAA